MLLEIPQTYVNYDISNKWFENVAQEKNRNLIEEKIYVLEHNDIYTAGKSISIDKNRLKTTNINNTPVFYCERGGLWTWHGKGQVVVYFIYNLRKHNMTISKFMNIIENVVIDIVNDEINTYLLYCQSPFNNGIEIYADQVKRGFWIKNLYTKQIAKFGFIGLKISNGFITHGISINYNNNLEPFSFINPCGLGNVRISSIETIINSCINNNKVNCTKQNLDINKFKLKLGSSLIVKLSE